MHSTSNNPTISSKIPRSIFNRNNQHKTTFNAGLWIPIFKDEVLPGDTFKIKLNAVIRQSTLIFPIMDNAFIDVHFYFVPNRIIWDKWKAFNGESKTAWIGEENLTIPQTTSPNGGWIKYTIADYLGLPTLVDGLSVSSLPARAYVKIWNDWLRDENLQNESLCSTGEATTPGSNGNNYLEDPQKMGEPLPSNKYADYFTKSLPSPQKGPTVPIPLNIGGLVPVTTKNITHSLPPQEALWMHIPGSAKAGNYYAHLNKAEAQRPIANLQISDTTTSNIGTDTWPRNLWADLSKATSITPSTINDLRLAFQIQKMYEIDARGGTRYTEMIQAHFGVHSPDARQQRTEYLGGIHQPLNVTQVPQTSNSDTTSPQANLAAFGMTNVREGLFTKSFTEHGYIIGIATIRTEHTYQQGIERDWLRKTRTDFYLPVFANLGEQGIYNAEIYAQGTEKDKEIFGFNERWAEMRFKFNQVTGAFRSNTQGGSLDKWGYWDNYNELPQLSDGWIRETKNNIDRTLAIKSEKQPQFIADFYFENRCSRLMPVYSIPGNIDRN